MRLRSLSGLLVLGTASGCEPELIVGTWTKSSNPTAGSSGAGSGGNAGSSGAGSGGNAGSSGAGSGGEAGCDATFVTEGEGGAPTGPVLTPVTVPWSTGFENEFCEYAKARGFCYADPDASFESSTSPVHDGQNAAAFSVTSDPALDGRQTRCVREGV